MDEQEKYDNFIKAVKLEQNFNNALYYSIIAGIFGSLFWLFVVSNTGYYFKFIPIILGLIIGYVIKFTGKGIEKKFGILGVVVTLFSIFFGDLLLLIYFSAQYENITMTQLLGNLDYGILFSVYLENFIGATLAYFILGAIFAYFNSFRYINYQSEVTKEYTDDNNLKF